MAANKQLLDYLSERKSVPLSMMSGPGPDEDTLGLILKIAARSPDHGRLEPWRFIIYRGDAVLKAGEALLERAIQMRGPLSDADADRERNRLNRAPVAIGVVSRITDTSTIPDWEQFLSAGAVCMNLVHAANAAGFAANWVTGWYSDDAEGRRILGLEETERMAGIVHIGMAKTAIPERPRPDVGALTTEYSGPAK